MQDKSKKCSKMYRLGSIKNTNGLKISLTNKNKFKFIYLLKTTIKLKIYNNKLMIKNRELSQPLMWNCNLKFVRKKHYCSKNIINKFKL